MFLFPLKYSDWQLSIIWTLCTTFHICHQ